MTSRSTSAPIKRWSRASPAIFAQVRRRGDAWYRDTLEPLPDGGPISFAGYRFGNDFWIDPGHPDAAAYTAEVLLHLVRRYDLDGLHLDRIRYPELAVGGQTPATGASIGCNPTSLGRFQRHYGLPEGGPPPDPGDPHWSQWRRDQVTALVRRIYLGALAHNPALKVSAALIAFGAGPTTEATWPGAEAFWRVYQDWRAWTEEGLVDLAVPMIYKSEHTPAGAAAFDQWSHWTTQHQYGRAALIGQALPSTPSRARCARPDGPWPQPPAAKQPRG